MRIIAKVISRANSKPRCSGCGKHRSGYHRMSQPRKFEFIPIWNIPVLALLYHAPGELPRLRHQGRGCPLGAKQACELQCLTSFSCIMGHTNELERNRSLLPDKLGQRLPFIEIICRFGNETPRFGRYHRHRCR